MLFTFNGFSFPSQYFSMGHKCIEIFLNMITIDQVLRSNGLTASNTRTRKAKLNIFFPSRKSEISKRKIFFSQKKNNFLKEENWTVKNATKLKFHRLIVVVGVISSHLFKVWTKNSEMFCSGMSSRRALTVIFQIVLLFALLKLFKGKNNKRVIHKWRHAIRAIRNPLPPSSRLSFLRLWHCRHNILDALGSWRQLWTTLYMLHRILIFFNVSSSSEFYFYMWLFFLFVVFKIMIMMMVVMKTMIMMIVVMKSMIMISWWCLWRQWLWW